MSNLAEQFGRNRRWRQIAAVCAVIAAIAAGLAGFATNVLSIRETVYKLLALTPSEPVEVALRDIRVAEVRSRKERVNLTIEAVIEKKGKEELLCEAGLLTKNHEFGPRGASWGVSRPTGDGWFDYGYFPSNKLHISPDHRHGIGQFYYDLPASEFMKTTQFRFDCGSFVTRWMKIELPDPTPWKD